MMPDYVVLSTERHAETRFIPPAGHGAHAGRHVLPLIGADIARLAPMMPIGFVEGGDRLRLVAICGGAEEGNLFIAPDGRWLGGALPFAFALHPFRWALADDGGQGVLAFDAASELVGEGPEFQDGIALFEEDGSMSKMLRKIAADARRIERNRLMTERALAAIAQADILEPWPAETDLGDNHRAISGLRRLSDARFAALGDDAFLALRHAGALPLLYGHVFSRRSGANLDRMAALRDTMAAASARHGNGAQTVFCGLSDDDLLF